MKQIEKIKMLVGMLEENMEILESFPTKVEEWGEKMDKHRKQYGDTRHFYESYPVQGTSQSHIENIARLIRKELLKV